MISLADTRAEVVGVTVGSLTGCATTRGRWEVDFGVVDFGVVDFGVVVFVDAAARVRGVRVVGLFTGAGATI